MKTRSRNALLGLAAGMLLQATGTSANAQNVVVNGSFEASPLGDTQVPPPTPNPFPAVGAGWTPGRTYSWFHCYDLNLPNWQPEPGLYFWPAPTDGEKAVYMGGEDGGIMQTVKVTPGVSYTLTFDFGGAGRRITEPPLFEVVVYRTASGTTIIPSWRKFVAERYAFGSAEIEFTPDVDEITLDFSNYGRIQYGFVALDNVVLQPTITDAPPIANAGVDFSVNEGQLAVALDGSGSSDPDNDPLTYEWVQVGGTTVALTGATTVSPTFTAPVVPLGGETLSFDLTVTANGEASVDTVSVTVVNVNHPPVADAGIDQTLANANAVAEGSPVTLHGEDSFDIDNDVIDFAWTQVSGPAVTLVGANTANPTFDAPYFEAGGAAGVVATLTFELLVDDGFPADAPAEGYTLANVRDTVTIEITNTNNLPVAAAGTDQTVDENTSVVLNGSLSTDPDNDALTYAWTQVGGTPVVLSAGDTASPNFTAPFVSAGGADLEFQLSVDDGYGGSATDNVIVHVQNANDPPLASAAQPTIDLLWPPTHGLVAVGITGVSDPDNNATIVITSVTQDEPTNGLGDGDTAIDAIIDGDAVLVRAERSGKGDGRVYHIHFTASDFEGSASGMVTVTVPQSKKKTAVDGGELFNSTE